MRTLPVLCTLILVACSDESGPANDAENSPAKTLLPDTSIQGPGLSGSFKVWHEDFPGAPDSPSLSPAAPNPWYDKSRRQALSKVIDNLTGTCTRDAWRMAREFFDRVEEDDLPMLIEHMDEAYQNPNASTVVANAVEAMGRARNPIFAEALLRALDHGNEGVRGKAMEALVYSGNKESVLRASNLFNQMTQRSQIFWLKAARIYLGEEAAEWYSALLQQPNYTPLHPIIINEVEEMSPALAVRVFEPLWENPPPNMRPHIAGLRYANGDLAGAQIVKEYLVKGTADEKLVCLNGLVGQD
ncbi:MAG: HEAT repeat domain-containing protein, partial [Planctomycetota bacterium]